MMLQPVAPPPSYAFHVVEVMSRQRYHLKRTSSLVSTASVTIRGNADTTSNIVLGYVAAPMAFSFDTEEVVLTVNGIRKVRVQQSRTGV